MKNNIAERIRISRKHASITQNELANLLKISTRTIQNYENGNKEPSISTTKEIAKICDVNTSWLLSGEGKMERDVKLSNNNIQYSNIAIGDNITIKETHSKEVSDLEDKLLKSYRSLPEELQELYFHKIRAEAIENKMRAKEK